MTKGFRSSKKKFPSTKGPTVHSSRPVVHPVGTSIDFINDRKFPFVRERDRRPAKVQDELMERARVKRARRREKRFNEVQAGGWR